MAAFFLSFVKIIRIFASNEGGRNLIFHSSTPNFILTRISEKLYFKIKNIFKGELVYRPTYLDRQNSC